MPADALPPPAAPPGQVIPSVYAGGCVRSGAVIRIKICGITMPADAEAAASAGADAIGLNFVAGPRRIDVPAATAVLSALPPMCTPVALVDVSTGDVPEYLLEVLGRYWVCHLQLYGSVTADTLARLLADGFKPILVQHVSADGFPGCVEQALSRLGPGRPAAVLLDAQREGLQGGTGMTLDWNAVAAAREAGRTTSWPPTILAGGLRPDNVAEAVSTVRPWGVDVSSGVERSLGRKDPELMAAFVARARAAAQA